MIAHADAVRDSRPTVLQCLIVDQLPAMSWPGFAINWPPMESSVLVVASPIGLPRVDCRGGVQARQTAPDTAHLVSAAATLLGGDTMNQVIVEQGAQLRLPQMPPRQWPCPAWIP